MMTSTFSIDLGLDSIEVMDVTTDENGHYHLKLRSTENRGYLSCLWKKDNNLL